ncbi:hypothetical protein [Brevinema andersonii]|uniref:hypothetical protein n=1 Tax=Brevinema andersonii TaxID=34097 RepID=UPI000B8A5FA1|nr:hypothetical protein [Brevinema andersonii]
MSAKAVESAVSNAFSREHIYVKLDTLATKPSARGQVQIGSYLLYDTTVLMVMKDITNEVIYNYEVMHTNSDCRSKVSNTILYLSSSGEYNGKFVGFSVMEENAWCNKNCSV